MPLAMCLSTPCIDGFLTGLARSSLLSQWLRRRALSLPDVPNSGDAVSWSAAIRGWAERLSILPRAQQEAIGRELEGVQELARPLGNAHLLEVAGIEANVPAKVPSGMPLALWFLLHRPGLFDEVRRNHPHRDEDIWMAVRTPPTGHPRDPRQAAGRLAAGLEAAFARTVLAGWQVAVHQLDKGSNSVVAFSAVARKPQGSGLDRPTPSARPARHGRVQYVHYLDQGTLLLQPGLGPQDQVDRLLDCFTKACGLPLLAGAVFDLDRLRWPFRPVPDALDMESARLKALHLCYPQRDGRRVVTLDTLESDGPDAVQSLLQRHVDDEILPHLSVTQAVFQVRLIEDGRPRVHLFRLWRNHCDLGVGALGHRMLACVRSWGL